MIAYFTFSLWKYQCKIQSGRIEKEKALEQTMIVDH